MPVGCELSARHLALLPSWGVETVTVYVGEPERTGDADLAPPDVLDELPPEALRAAAEAIRPRFFHADLEEPPMGYFVADISGHDLGASFVTSSLKVLLRQNSGPLFTPVETLKNMNSVLTTLFRDGKHLTAALLCLNRLRKRLVLVSAGHPPAILVGADGKARLLAADGDILGAFETVQFGVLEQPVEPGDRIYLYTDGLVERFGVETRSRSRGMEELLAGCRRVAGLPLDEAVAALVASAQQAGRPDDDTVLLGIEV